MLLRLTVGWHFFYEGVWKTNPDNKFSAIPFLGMAKGPAAEMFYAMLPDVDGATRLLIEEKKITDPNDPKAKERKVKSFVTFDSAWEDYLQKFEAYYNLKDEKKKEAEALLKRYQESNYDYAAEVGKDIEAYVGSYERYKKSIAEQTNGAEHQKKRDWDQMLKLRGEVTQWSGYLSGLGDDFQSQLWNILEADQQNSGQLPKIAYGNNKILVTAPSLGINSWVDFLNFSVTWGLTAIGFCLLLGFCSRLAALGGAAFLVSVLLTQWPWPSVYPPFSPEVGHSMIVDKNFVEMMACLVIASLPAGRWGGLDFFLYYCLGGKCLASKYCCCGESCDKKSENNKTAPAEAKKA